MSQRSRGLRQWFFILSGTLAALLALGPHRQTRGGDVPPRALDAAPEHRPAPHVERRDTDRPISAIAQTSATLPDLRDYDWTSWLVGVWEGWIENAEDGRTPLRQSFEYAADGRHILTRLRIGSEEDPAYFGVGIFSYDPGRGLSSADWFGMLGDRNYALGRRDGEAWVWDIHRHGRERVQRVRARVSDDEYRVTSTTITGDGGTRVSREQMKRVRPNVE